MSNLRIQYDAAAVVVTYNRKDLLKQNIECLLTQATQCDIYIIDNASTDGTEKLVRSYTDERVYYFNTGANLGGAGGFEYGTREAVKAGYKYVWIMDDDTLVHNTALEELMQADRQLNGKWGALSSTPYWTDGSICKANRQKKTLFTFVKDEEYKRDVLIPVTMASFVSLLVKADVIKEIGLPIGEYFIWTDDYEYTGRISRKYPVYVVPKSCVTHAMKENKKINFAQETPDRIDRYRYVYRNDVHCYRQFGIKGWMYLILKYIFTVMNILLKSETPRCEKLKVLDAGYKQGICFEPEIKFVK